MSLCQLPTHRNTFYHGLPVTTVSCQFSRSFQSSISFSLDVLLVLRQPANRSPFFYPTSIPWEFYLLVWTPSFSQCFFQPFLLIHLHPFCHPLTHRSTLYQRVHNRYTYEDPKWATTTKGWNIHPTKTRPDTETKKQLSHHNSRCLDPSANTQT